MKHKGKLHKKNDVWVVKKTEGDMEEYLLHPGNTNFVEALLFHKKFEVDEEITFNFGIDCLEKCNNV